jgi:hypothetical protein
MYEGKTVENMVDWPYEKLWAAGSEFRIDIARDLENFYYIDRTFHSNPGG